jgi:hypothetical protein
MLSEIAAQTLMLRYHLNHKMCMARLPQIPGLEHSKNVAAECECRASNHKSQVAYLSYLSALEK